MNEGEDELLKIKDWVGIRRWPGAIPLLSGGRGVSSGRLQPPQPHHASHPLSKGEFYAALVSRERETNETSETRFWFNYLTVSILCKMSETKWNKILTHPCHQNSGKYLLVVSFRGGDNTISVRKIPYLLLRAIGSISFVAMDFNPLKIINDN